jgi:tRNA pseudouridine38-40 synthase
MPTYRLTIAYDGTEFSGWQLQDNAPSIQGAVEESLAALLGGFVRVFGAGRTDAGVHARGQEASFRLERPFKLPGLVHGVNHLLPPTIRVLAAARMTDRFHAQRRSLAKEYRYRLYRARVVPPQDHPFVLEVTRQLDLNALRRALGYLQGHHDFSAFAISGGSHEHGRRRMFAATLEERGAELQLSFLGDGFLRGMVRTLVGTLLQVGRGERPAADIAKLLKIGQARGPITPSKITLGRATPGLITPGEIAPGLITAGPTAAARGLCLERVFYPPHWQPLESYEA